MVDNLKMWSTNVNGFLTEESVTVISIIVSAIISQIISKHYYNKANRENLKMEVIFPMHRLLKEEYSRANYTKLSSLSEKYWVRYMKRKENKAVVRLVKAYQEISNYDIHNVNAEILRAYFEYKLKKNGIEIKPVPIYAEDEVVDWDYPGDVYLLRSNLKKLLERYELEFEEAECEQQIINLFNYYCSEYYTKDEISYFDDYKFNEVFVKSKIKEEWNQKFREIVEAKQQFDKLAIVKKIR